MKLHAFDAEDGLFYHLANTYRQIFCSLVAHLIAGLIFVEGLVWFDVFFEGSETLLPTFRFMKRILQKVDLNCEMMLYMHHMNMF